MDLWVFMDKHPVWTLVYLLVITGGLTGWINAIRRR